MAENSSDVRRKTAQAMEQLLLQVAEDARVQQEEIRNRFPRMSSLPPPLRIDPNVIEDLVNSRAYRDAVNDYISGRVEENIIITVLRLLKALMPMLLRGL